MCCRSTRCSSLLFMIKISYAAQDVATTAVSAFVSAFLFVFVFMFVSTSASLTRTLTHHLLHRRDQVEEIPRTENISFNLAGGTVSPAAAHRFGNSGCYQHWLFRSCASRYAAMVCRRGRAGADPQVHRWGHSDDSNVDVYVSLRTPL